ncbi:UDP-3-O-acyl-N-acetylglucosamine deacetylase [Neorhodopirellula pilleata]|uniref:UDP-3-O-acyl-N-acetylglucosamine deacetylase n=1 Tax=Neorhodopirellula pilleata TaxID=2714738 RepID=A0A5C6AQF4_9BACT|nr:UDP-3-O-acyl-N-acetylglucosamine deacetylase [Neorhodopirellula pilleata]TWU01788.1 UDP-3-O-[3-hydroxymyristoyl] N-acetylglucosamine deacetylase [Neorhodopirellula pilleata]
MIGYRNEHTIAASCEVSGRGYWSGQDVCIRFHPAPISTGVVFVRTDLEGRPECPARSEFTDSVQFRTNLVRGAARFEMVEHLMAALAGLEIDNCLIETDACEMPGLDGSCDAFVRCLQSAGLVIQAASKPRLVITEAIRVEADGAFVEALPSPDGCLRFSYSLDYGQDSCIRPQSFEINCSPRSFVRQVAPARTFVTLDQAEQLRASGVARHVTNQELLVIGHDGVVDNEYRFRNECARHKTLDLIGDLSLAGLDLVGQFHSHRGGHRLNGMLASGLASLANANHYKKTFQSTRKAA